MKKRHFILLIVLAALPLIIIFSVFLYTTVNRLSIFPSEKYTTGWWFYNNEETDIHSLETGSQKIDFEYTLKGSPAFAGFGVHLDRNYPFLDLSKYTKLTVKISISKAKHFGVVIQTFEKGITQLKDGYYTPLRYCQIRTKVLKNSDTYSIELSKLKAPDWWITQNGVPGKDLQPDPLKKSAIMQFLFDDFDDTELLGQKDRVEIYEITFHSSSALSWIIIAIGTACYYIVFTGILVLPHLRRNRENSRRKLLTSYKRISQENSWQKDAEIVRSYISEHYNDPDISCTLISSDVGLTLNRIKEIIRKEYGMNLKACISWLRIQEAKRLLIESDFNISEIAFRLGFNSNSYFSSIFKKHVGMSPKEYKEKSQLKI